jgi:hypothetical protein
VTSHQIDERCLAGAIGPDQADDFSRLKRKRDLIDGFEAAKTTRQALNLKKRRAHAGLRR